jgi:hypothetical protein
MYSHFSYFLLLPLSFSWSELFSALFCRVARYRRWESRQLSRSATSLTRSGTSSRRWCGIPPLQCATETQLVNDKTLAKKQHQARKQAATTRGGRNQCRQTTTAGRTKGRLESSAHRVGTTGQWRSRKEYTVRYECCRGLLERKPSASTPADSTRDIEKIGDVNSAILKMRSSGSLV